MAEYEIEIRREGSWFCPWSWSIYRKPDRDEEGNLGKGCYDSGMAWTKDRAHRDVVKAKQRMEHDLVQIVSS